MVTVSLGLALSACGDSDTKDVIDEIINSAPVISSTGVLTVDVGTAYSYTFSSSDTDGDELTVSTSTLPAWLSFDSATGTLSGTPTENDAGEQAITLTVNDGTVDVTQSFTITVSAPVVANNAPVITSTGITSAMVGEAYSYMLTATDADSDTLTMSANISATLSWLSFDAVTGILSGTPTSAEAAMAINLTVNDGTDDAMQTFDITVSDAVTGPAPALVVYEDVDNADWPLWGGTGSAASIVTDTDAAYGEVANFVIVGSDVAGFNNRDAGGAGSFTIPAGTTTIEFDLKLIKQPDNGATDWMLKLEGSTDGDGSEVNLTTSLEGQAPALGTWMHYTFNVGSFNVSDIDLVMIFPAWGQGSGAEYNVDNVIVSVTPDDGTRTPGNAGDDATTNTTAGIDFEGSQLTWESFDTAKVQFVANPETGGINTSSTVALVDIIQADNEWAGIRTEGIDIFKLDTSNCVVKLDVYKDTIGDVLVKFEQFNGDGWGSHGTVAVPNTVTNQWETLTFDTCHWIDLPQANTIGGFAMHVDPSATRATGTMMYLDNIMFTAQGNVVTPPTDPSGPAVSAPVPTPVDGDVISVFSDGYTAVANVDTNPNWGQATVTTVETIEGNATLKMAGLNYQGIAYANQNVSGKTTLHLDYWTADATAFEVFLIGAGGETNYTVTTTQSGWQSVDIPLTAFSGVVDLTDVFQFKFDAQNLGGGTIYLDNLYFSGDSGVVVTPPTTPVGPTTLVADPTLAAGDVISLHTSGDVYTNIVVNDWNPNWGQSGSIADATVAGKTVKKVDFANYQGIDFDSATKTDLTGKATLHMSVYADSTAAFNVFVITGAAEVPVSTGPLVADAWNEIEVDLSATGSLSTAYQIKLDGGTGQSLWLDNVYFH